MKIINAGVTAPKGFKCAGLRAGVKSGKTNKDMAMIVSEVPAKIAGTFTKNIVKAAPVLWGKKIVEEQEAVRAVVINTGIANACTGAQGYENVVTEAKEVAKLLDIRFHRSYRTAAANGCDQRRDQEVSSRIKSRQTK